MEHRQTRQMETQPKDTKIYEKENKTFLYNLRIL